MKESHAFSRIDAVHANARNENTVTSALYTFIIARCSTKSNTTRSFANDTHLTLYRQLFAIYKNISFSSSQQPRRARHIIHASFRSNCSSINPYHFRRASVKSSKLFSHSSFRNYMEFGWKSKFTIYSPVFPVTFYLL